MTSLLQVEVMETVDKAQWDDTARTLSAPVFHSSDWSVYRCRQAGRTPLFVQWYEQGDPRPVAMALGVLVPVVPRLRRFATRLEFDSPPASRVDGADLVTPVAEWARARPSIVEIRLGSFDPRAKWREGVLPNSQKRLEFTLDPGPKDQVLSRMHRLARRSIRKAEKFEIAVRVGGREDVTAFAALHGQTRLRLNRKKGVPVGALDIEGVRGLLEAGVGRLYVAQDAGRPIVGWLFGTFGASAYSLLSGDDDRAHETGAVSLLLTHALSDLADRGFETVNLGGVDASASDPDSSEHGLFRFKAGLGAEPMPCEGGRLVCRATRAALVESARRIARRRVRR